MVKVNTDTCLVGRTMDEQDYTVVASEYKGMSLNSPNEVTVSPEGMIYFSDPMYGHQLKDLTIDWKGNPDGVQFEGVYRVKDGKTELVTKELSGNGPNGLAFSKDGSILWVTSELVDSKINAFKVSEQLPF